MRRLAPLLLLTLLACRDKGGADTGQDADGDGVFAALDCDDADAGVYPDAPELCDGKDNDCDGEEDEGAEDAPTWYIDGDNDGYGRQDSAVAACTQPPGHVALGGDCDDLDPAFHPGAAETDCTDPADYNCDGSVGFADADADGVPACEDCDDGDAARSPTAAEVCDGVDNDCDGHVDLLATDAPTWNIDVDNDGYGNPAYTRVECEAPTGWVADASDCDDTDPGIRPDAPEICDGVDNDCDNLTDDDDDSVNPASRVSWYRDRDLDGYGDPFVTQDACAAPTGYVADATDCDDSDITANPGASEVCDGSDNDCDGLVDDADNSLDPSGATEWFIDADRDGYGDPGFHVLSCVAPSRFVADGTDCDDSDAAIHPAATEVCDGDDNDCDNLTDDDDSNLDLTTASTWYRDGDGDGYGDPVNTLTTCDAPSGFVADDSDCNDGDPNQSPSGVEVCDNIDNDCDGTVDDGVCSLCGNGVLDPGEEVDPPNSPFSTLSVDPTTCRWDLSTVPQLYCNGGCTWSGGSDCDQTEADIFCKLRLDDPNARATSWTRTTALSQPGFPCRSSGTQLNIVDRGVSVRVGYQDTSILANHGPGNVIINPVCTR